ncbi:MAG: GNAT family N-acetyltransferase [Eubacterium sp.]|jgi:GNAT superfamily N-acetyltransferase|nr:GNAT family N-acetyltransferase [Eubacterium sp.]
MLLEENQLDIDTYLKLRKTVNWKTLTREQAEKAIQGSLFTVVAFDDGQPVGMGRIVGDGAVICYIQDLIVIPDYQRSGVGQQIMEYLIDYVKKLKLPDTEIMLDLMCAVGREEFYKKYGFIARPTEKLGPGMIMYIE